MPFSTVKPLLAEAEALLDGSGLRPMDEIIDVCCAGLGHLAREGRTYRGLVPFCSAIAPHFENELMGLVRTLRTYESGPASTFSFFGEVQGHAFSLVEDIALFMREKKLRNPLTPTNPTEERILSYFESCGQWPADSGEVVTDTYYKLLPIAVMRDLTAMAVQPETGAKKRRMPH